MTTRIVIGTLKESEHSSIIHLLSPHFHLAQYNTKFKDKENAFSRNDTGRQQTSLCLFSTLVKLPRFFR